MPTRLVITAVAAALLVSACSAGRSGPDRPADARVDVDDAVRASGAREAARTFIEAYARAPQDDGAALGPLVGTSLLRRWVGWLHVQDLGFPGEISGAADAILVGPAVPFEVDSVAGSDEILREVDVRASVTFSFVPLDGDPFSVVRSLDGPMRLLRGRDGDWSVLDFTRDSIPLSSQFEVVSGARATDGRVDVTVGAFFAAPIWQFGLIVRSTDGLRLSPKGITLVDAGREVVATAGAITTPLERIPPAATVRGLVTFDARPSAEGLVLRIEVRGRDGPASLEIPLAGTIHPIVVQTASPSPSAGG